MTDKHDFAYSVALIRTWETLLLNDNEVERMTLSKDASDAFRILNEFDCADNKSGIDSPAEFQKVVDEDLLEVIELLRKVTPDKRVLNIILHKYDFHNIKTLLKAKLSNKTLEEISHLLSNMGAIKKEALIKFIYEDENVPFNLSEQTETYLKKKIKKTIAQFEKDQDPQKIDLYLDQKLMKITYGIAVDSKNKFLIEYVKKLIDLNNIKLFFRMKAQNKELELYSIAFLWNGTVPYAKFKDAYQHALSNVTEHIKGPYAKLIETGLKHFEEEKTFIYLEREIENHLTEFIKRAKLIPFGPEPLIAYLLAKDNNAKILRMIMVNKLNSVAPEEIQKRLRTLYR
ncbi:MAG: V-type ATPase subunit [Candidatus Peregrinibacteria bacterium]